MLALREAGGVMLFDVNEDTYDETSVVSMIHNTLASMEALSDQAINEYVWLIIDNRAVLFITSDGMGVPFIDENSRTLVPVRKVLEFIGADVSFESDDDGKVVTVNAYLDGTHIAFDINSDKYLVNDKVLIMDTVAIIKEGRTYVPFRPMLEAFGYDVSWSETGRCVYAVSLPPE